MHPYLAKEGYTDRVSSLYIMYLQRIQVGGYYMHKRAPCRKLTLKRGGGRLIHTLQYELFMSALQEDELTGPLFRHLP